MRSTLRASAAPPEPSAPHLRELALRGFRSHRALSWNEIHRGSRPSAQRGRKLGELPPNLRAYAPVVPKPSRLSGGRHGLSAWHIGCSSFMRTEGAGGSRGQAIPKNQSRGGGNGLAVEHAEGRRFAEPARQARAEAMTEIVAAEIGQGRGIRSRDARSSGGCASERTQSEQELP